MGDPINRKRVQTVSDQKCRRRFGHHNRACSKGVEFAHERYEESGGGDFALEMAKADCRVIFEDHEYEAEEECQTGVRTYHKGIKDIGPSLAARKKGKTLVANKYQCGITQKEHSKVAEAINESLDGCIARYEEGTDKFAACTRGVFLVNDALQGKGFRTKEAAKVLSGKKRRQ